MISNPLSDLISRGLYTYGNASQTLRTLFLPRVWDLNGPNSVGLRPLQALLLQTGELSAYEFLVMSGAEVTPEILDFAETKFPHRIEVVRYLRAVHFDQKLPRNSVVETKTKI